MSLLEAINKALGFQNPSSLPRPDPHLLKVIQDFRKERSDQFSKLIEKNSTAGAELAVAREELQDWRDYARRLERVCLAAGLELPSAPDE